MEMFENGQGPENNTNDKPFNPNLNRDGGVFAEEDFSRNGSPADSPCPPYYSQQSNAYPNGGTASAGNPSPADNAYRQMYSGAAAPEYRGIYNAPAGMAQDRNMNMNYSSGGGYYYQPQVGAVPADAPVPEMKKSSKGWLIAVIVIVVLMFSAVMLLLAFGHKDGAVSDIIGNSGEISRNDTSEKASADNGNVTVNINVVPVPVEGDRYYQDKENGLLTPAGAAKQVLPSIVNLYGYKNTTLMPSIEASGIIISEDGYLITNAHATEEVTRFKARLNDDREFEAKLIGADTRTDLAVLKIEDAEGLVPAVIGKSSDMMQGEEVVAMGNAGGFNNTVTVGNVSYVDREIKSYTDYPIRCIQTDAALNFGNSGGALVNLYGQVVGIVVSKCTFTGSENIGFAISSDFAVPIVEDLIEKGYVTGRGRIGIIYSFIQPEYAEQMGVKPGLHIAEISEDCDVANTELSVDDIITEIDGIQMITQNSIKEFQNTHYAGDVVTAKVYRKDLDGSEREFEITFTLEEQK